MLQSQAELAVAREETMVAREEQTAQRRWTQTGKSSAPVLFGCHACDASPREAARSFAYVCGCVSIEVDEMQVFVFTLLDSSREIPPTKAYEYKQVAEACEHESNDVPQSVVLSRCIDYIDRWLSILMVWGLPSLTHSSASHL